MMPNTKVPLVRPASRESIDRWGDGFISNHYPDLLREPGKLPVLHLIDVLLPTAYDIDNGVELLPEGVDGISEPPNRLTISDRVYDGIARDIPRDRFTGAHEAVHAVLHLCQLSAPFESKTGVRLYRRGEVPAFVDPEWQANRGAAALLMPARMVWRLIGEHGYEPAALAHAFGVSFQAASNRVDDARGGRLWRPA